MRNQQSKSSTTNSRGEIQFAALLAQVQPSEQGQVLEELQNTVTLHSINSLLNGHQKGSTSD